MATINRTEESNGFDLQDKVMTDPQKGGSNGAKGAAKGGAAPKGGASSKKGKGGKKGKGAPNGAFGYKGRSV